MVDIAVDEAIDDGALADSAIAEEDYFVLDAFETAT